MDMKAKIDSELCIGCGLCASTCPDVYEMKDDKAIVKTNLVSPALEGCAKQAKDECPVEAIIVDG